MPSQFDSLATLLNGPQKANLPIDLNTLRLKRREDMLSSGAADQNPEDFGMLESDIAHDPGTGIAERKRIGGFNDVTDTVNTFNRPDVTAMRNEDLQGKAYLAAAPARAAAEGNMNAARLAAEARAQALSDMLMYGGNRRMSVGGVSMGADADETQNTKDTAMAARQGAMQQSIALRQRIDALQRGKASAPKSSFFESQSTANDREIKGLMDQLTAISGGNAIGPEAAGGAAAAAPAGRPKIRSIQQVQ